jgi:uncharacterized protein (TIGR02466 family)
MKDNFNVTPLFSIPLYQTVLQDVSSECLEYIKGCEYKRFPADNGYGTPNKFLLDLKELHPLKSQIMASCEHFLYDVLDVDKSIKFEITNSWANKHLKGDESGAHTHVNSMISGVFYVQTNEQSGEILFHKEKTNYNIFMPTVNIPFNGKNLNLFNSDGWAIRPKNNMLILFPSTLNHSVYPNQSDEERYCVAFNLFAFGKFGFDNVTQLGLDNTTQA